MEYEQMVGDLAKAVLDLKKDRYSFKPEDFEAPRELMVTITLGEYRDLIEKNAKAESKYYAEMSKRQTAEDALEKVKKELETWKNTFKGIKVDKEETDE